MLHSSWVCQSLPGLWKQIKKDSQFEALITKYTNESFEFFSAISIMLCFCYWDKLFDYIHLSFFCPDDPETLVIRW